MPHSSANFRLKATSVNPVLPIAAPKIKFFTLARSCNPNVGGSGVDVAVGPGVGVGSGGEVGVRVARLGKLGIDVGRASHALVTARTAAAFKNCRRENFFMDDLFSATPDRSV